MRLSPLPMLPTSRPRCRCSNHRAGRGPAGAVRPARPRLAPLRPRLHRPGRAAELHRPADHPRRCGRLLRGVLQLAPAVSARRRRRPAGASPSGTGRASPGSSPNWACCGTSTSAATTGSTRARACCCSTSCAWPPPTAGPSGRCASPSCTSTPPTATTTPSTASSAARTTAATPTATACSTATPTLAAEGGGDVRLPARLDPAEPGAARARARRGSAARRARCARRMGVGDTAVNLAAAGLVLNAWILSGEHALPRLDRRVRRRVAGARRRQRRCPAGQRRPGRQSSAACWRAAGTAATTAGPGRTAGTAWATRPSWRRWRRPRSPATTTTSTWSRPALDEIIARGKVMPFTEADSSLPSKWMPATRPGRATHPRCTCRSGTTTRAGSTTTRC